MTPTETPRDLTAAEVAERLRCSTRKVTKTASEIGVGANLGGRAGFRFTEAEVEELRASMRPDPVAPRRRRGRNAA